MLNASQKKAEPYLKIFVKSFGSTYTTTSHQAMFYFGLFQYRLQRMNTAIIIIMINSYIAWYTITCIRDVII
jgi:hypothetical protein